MPFQEGGGLVGLRHNILNKEWVEMYGVAYTPDVVTNDPKIHGVLVKGGVPFTTGRCGQIWGTRGYPYAEQSVVETDTHGYIGGIVLWDPCRMCFFEVRVVGIDENPMIGDTHTKSCLRMRGAKREIILRLALSNNITSHRVCCH